MIKLFTKTGCPWCDDVLDFLEDAGVNFEEIDVRRDPSGLAEMEAISGQTKAPTMQLEDGSVLADFDVSEMRAFFREKGIEI